MARTYQKKSWTKSKTQRDHETQLALINAFARDPELKYFVGMAAGAGVAWVGSMLGGLGQTTTTTTTYSGALSEAEWSKWHMLPGAAQSGQTYDQYLEGYAEKQKKIEEIKDIAYGYLALQFGGVTGLATLKAIDWSTGEGSTSGFFGNFGNIMKLGGVSFAGTCAMILILRSIFSGTDLGELLSGVGEIIPL